MKLLALCALLTALRPTYGELYTVTDPTTGLTDLSAYSEEEMPNQVHLPCSDPPKKIDYAAAAAGLDRTWLGSSNLFWPEAVLSYRFVGDWEENHRTLVETAMERISSASCVTFNEIADDDTSTYYVALTNDDFGCWSYVGYLKAINSPNFQEFQQLNLQKENTNGHCMHLGTAIHELLHALGTFHEQSRLDRDHWVSINYGNIDQSAQSNFDVADGTVNFGSCYDFKSVMHYSLTAFAINPNIYTIKPHNETVTSAGGNELSATDIYEINAAYCGLAEEVPPPPCEVPPTNASTGPFVLPSDTIWNFRSSECVLLETDNWPEAYHGVDDIYRWYFTMTELCHYGTVRVHFNESFHIPESNRCKDAWLKVYDIPLRLQDGQTYSKICNGFADYSSDGPPAFNPMTFQAPLLDSVKVFYKTKARAGSAQGFRAEVCAIC